MDGIIFLLIVGGIVGVTVWRKKVKKAAQEKLFAEQWTFLRTLETKIDSLIEGQAIVVDSANEVKTEIETLNKGLI